MPKTGRNDPCPCGSGQKYKRCCLAKHQEVEHASLTAQDAERRAQVDEAIASWTEANELDDASNSIVGLIHAGRYDEAEQAARDLLVRYPQVPDGHLRLGMLYEAKGQKRDAADAYRHVVEFMRAHPGDFDLAFENDLLEQIAERDPTSQPALIQPKSGHVS